MFYTKPMRIMLFQKKKEKKEKKEVRARLVCVFKNWKLLFKNICENTCGWKNTLKCMKYCLKTENGCLETQTKHPLMLYTKCFTCAIRFLSPKDV